MSAAPNWVSIVGYRHEVVHTGVLRHLLDDPAFGPRIAAQLTGADVVAVRGARQESKVHGFKGKADLIAELELASGNTVAMAVETKVDSDGSRDQLRATAAPPHYGVLFAVGLTTFKLGQPELDPDLPHWRAVGPHVWQQLLDELIAHRNDDYLAAYASEIRRETAEHAAAVELSRQPAKPAPRLSVSRRGDGYLEDFAWLAEVRARFEHPHWWATKTSMSGPLMGHWPSEWQREDRVNRYVEFMCFGRGRFLMLKVGSDKPGRLGNLPRELWAIAEPLGWRAPLRRHGPRAKSCSAAWLDLTLLPPEQAAERARAELEALSAVLDK